MEPDTTKKPSKKASNTFLDNNSFFAHKHKRPQVNSNELERPHMTSNDPEVKPVKSKINLKGGGNIEITENFSDEPLHNSKI